MNVHFNINLTKTQQKIYDLIHDKAVREVVAVTSRQIGKTVLAELLAIETLITKKCNVAYVSPDYSQGKKVFRELINILSPTGLIAKKNSSDLTIELTNGSIMLFFSAKNATAMRGQTISGMLILDETAFIPETTPDGQNIYHNIIRPITKARNPKILFLSTPHGKHGLFYDKYLESLTSDKVKSVVATIYDDELISKEEIKELKASTPKIAWEQEFECKFLDSALTAIEGFEMQFVDKQEVINENCVWIGADMSANGEDRTVVTFIDKENNTKQYLIEGTLDQKYKKIAELIDKYKGLQIAYLENNGVGEAMINEVKKLVKKNKSKMLYWTTTNDNKNEMVANLQLAMNNNEITFSNDNKELYSEFGTFEYTINKKTRRITYGAKSPKHDDYVMSLLIALRAKQDYPNTSLKARYTAIGSYEVVKIQ